MMNEFESGLVYNFEKLGCKGLAEKLSGIFSSTHVRDSELLSVLTAATSEEIVRIKQAKAERLLRQASLFNTYANVDLLEYIPERNIDKALIDRLCSCAYIDEAVNVIALSVEEQCIVLSNMITYFGMNIGLCNLSLIGGKPKTGTLTLASNVDLTKKKLSIIFQSITGLFSEEVEIS